MYRRPAIGGQPGKTRFFFGVTGRAILVIGLALGLSGIDAAGGREEDLIRQLKIDVFDQNWAAVLAGCEAILESNPGSQAAAQAAFYRTRALGRLPGRETEAIESLRQFLRSAPGDRLLVEEAWSSLFTIACAGKRQESRTCAGALEAGLAEKAPFVSTLAAIRAADVSDPEVRRRALPVLKRAYGTPIDADIRNEILIAILKIDPAQVPAPDVTPSPRSGGTATADGRKKPAFIRMSVFNKEDERFEIKVQFPVAFARMLIDSLGETRRDDLRREARLQGMNIDEIFEAIRNAGTGRLLEVDTGDSIIEIWIE